MVDTPLAWAAATASVPPCRPVPELAASGLAASGMAASGLAARGLAARGLAAPVWPPVLATRSWPAPGPCLHPRCRRSCGEVTS